MFGSLVHDIPELVLQILYLLLNILFQCFGCDIGHLDRGARSLRLFARFCSCRWDVLWLVTWSGSGARELFGRSCGS